MISTGECFLFVVRLVSEKTVEENILKKANQKRMLGDVAIEGGNFTTASLQQVCTSLQQVCVGPLHTTGLAADML